MAELPEDEALPENELGEEQEAEEETDGASEELDEPEEESEDSAEAGAPAGSTGEASASRRESRNARQARENRELREKLARLEGERSAWQNRQQPDPEVARRQREEQLALMEPEERARFQDRETIQRLEQQSQRTQFMMADIQDKNSFDILCTSNPVAEKYRSEVEDLLQKMRSEGSTAPRETLLKFIIGERAMKTAKKPAAKKQTQQRREEAQSRVSQAQGKGTSARGDAGGSSRSGGSLEDRILAREEEMRNRGQRF